MRIGARELSRRTTRVLGPARSVRRRDLCELRTLRQRHTFSLSLHTVVGRGDLGSAELGRARSSDRKHWERPRHLSHVVASTCGC